MYDVVIIMKKTLLGRLAFILFATVFAIIFLNGGNANASNNGLAQKPYMGWSSYSMQVYTNGLTTWITEAQIKAQSDAMHTYLQSHGYDRINIDAGWNSGIDGYGRPVPSAALYPSGFTNLVNYVHANGQNRSLYDSRNVERCLQCQFANLRNSLPYARYCRLAFKNGRLLEYWL
jgi:hypothetical protein